ncbi:MAG: TolC family protein [Burkholderiales bacterium]|jgi:outer membrane protein TolC
MRLHRRRVVLATAAAAASALSACSTTPTPATRDERAARTAADLDAMFTRQEPVRGPITYPEAAARALVYNFDLRARAMEGALATGQLDVSRFDQMPRMLANAGWTTRGAGDGSRTQTVETGVESTLHQTSTERSRRIASAEFSWNVLDFGVSYFRSKQLADQVLVAEERRRKVVQNLMVDVRNAYWRALGAQRLTGRIDALIARSNAALERAREVERRGVIPAPQALDTQRRLFDAILLLQFRRQELELAKSELAGLMALPPGTDFLLADGRDTPLPPPPGRVTELEALALERRPELQEEFYRTRITANEVRRAIASTLPNLGIDLAGRYDSNRFLFDNTWIDGGVRLSVNLFRLASIPAVNRAGEAQRDVDDARRMAQAMAVLTQVRVATLRYGLAVAEHDQVVISAGVDQRLLGYSRAASTARIETELDLVRNEARALLSEYQRHIAYANAQAAWGRIFNSIGYDVEVPPPQAGVAQTAAAVERSLAQWQRMTFESAAAGETSVPVGAAAPARR